VLTAPDASLKENLMPIAKAYDEIVNFIAAGNDALQVSQFQASQETKDRAALLIERFKRDELTPEEKSELDSFLCLEHVMRLAKAKARLHLQGNTQP
jgi:hypothetical protein